MPHTLDNLYRGDPIFVLSTGTSLRGFDFRRLNGHFTIGVNRIVEHYHPSIMFFVDVTAKTTHAGALQGYTGMVIAGPGAAPHVTSARSSKSTRTIGHGRSSPHSLEEALRAGHRSRISWAGASTSGCTASALAARRCTRRILLGGSPIFLLGYDFYEDRGSHFDDVDASRNGRDVVSARSRVHRRSRARTVASGHL